MNWTIRPFFIALQFLTRLPIGIRCQYNDIAVGRSLLYYPIVGLIIGGLLAVVAWGLSFTAASSFISAATILTCWVCITGGLHIDGLADSADAWIGGHGGYRDRDKALAIMKDPCCGPAAVMIVVLVLLLKVAALEHILSHFMNTDHMTILLLIVCIPIMARTVVVALFLGTHYARESGLGSAIAQFLPRRTAAVICIISFSCIAWCIGPQSKALFLSTALCFLFLRRLMLQRIGGCTGDTAGALLEIAETLGLIALACTLT